MLILFYSAPMSSSSPVESALHELAVPHEKIRFDLSKNDQKSPAFLKLNPNGKVPTLVVDGTPMFEALAIMQWLGDRYGVARGVWPAADAPARMRALSYSTWAYVQYGATVRILNQAASDRSPAELRNRAQAELAQRELQGLLGILDRELAQQRYLIGNEFGLVDLIVASVVAYGSYCGASPKAHARVSEWLDRCMERPSMKAAWG